MDKLSQVFQYEDKPVRTVVVNGEPWFVAKDVCDILELGDVSKAVSRLDEDEKGTNSIPTPGGNQEMLVINEPGLYSLILGSRKPEAKLFKRWVVHEVLPAIRQTGMYAVPAITQDAPLIGQLQVLQQVVNGMVVQAQAIEQMKRQQFHLVGKVEQIENKIEKRLTDDFAMQLVTPTQIGKMFEPSISAIEVNKRLRAAGLQWKVGGEWVATVEGRKYSSSEPVQLAGGKMIYQLQWQRRVKDLIL